MSETMMTVAEWHRLRDEDRMCWECGFHSPLVPVCGECEAHGKGIDAGRAAAGGEIAALTAERDSLRSALSESARTIEGIRDELMAANLDVSTDDDSATFAHHVFVLRMALEELGDQLDTAIAERDEARKELDELLDAIIVGPLEAGTMQDTIISLRKGIATALTERDEARSRLAKAREEVEAFATPVDLMRQRIERDTASAIAAWIVSTFGVDEQSEDVTTLSQLLAGIRANAWRSK